MTEIEPPKGQVFTRRELVEKLLATMAAGAAWPLIASSHPIHQLVKDGVILDRADAAQKAPDWKPLFLTAPQSETLTTLSEAIVPGSAKAQVNRFLDLLLSVDEKENQERFVTALVAIDGEAHKQFGRPFHNLTASEQEDLLTGISNHGPQKPHFDHLKEWIAIGYYSSEQGMRELGWAGNRAFRNFPACEDPVARV